MRIINAIENSSEDVVIQNAKVSGKTLFISNCAGEMLEVPIEQIPFLSKLSEDELSDFKINKFGFYISWKDKAFELDYEGFRYIVDETFRCEIDAKNLNNSGKYGEAIAAVRKKYNLTQSDINDYSDRQIRRIEKGEQGINSKILISLAKSHKLSYEEYLNELMDFLNK